MTIILSIIFLISILLTGERSNTIKAILGISIIFIFYKKILKDYSSVKTHKVKDNISKDPINKEILEVFNSKNKRIGFVREIITTTGCNSACLPLIATLFYNTNKQFITLQSSVGLTKKNHVAITYNHSTYYQ